MLSADELGAFERELRACIGIPWRHMGRQGLSYGHQTGLDCVGLLIRAGRAVGRAVAEPASYSREPDGTLRARLVAHLGPPAAPPDAIGCVALIRFRAESHVGYITQDHTLIHAYNGGERCVVEHPLGLWGRRIVARWAL